MTTSECRFCGSEIAFAYRIGDHEIGNCKGCRSCRAMSMPDATELSEFYNGFNFQTDPANYIRVQTPEIERWMRGLLSGEKGKMLDVGGGGGFFAKAFEDFGLGWSTYIDMDNEACDFARDQMGLNRVICDSVEQLDNHMHGERFDFIYCRHVIEHLVDPVSLILSCANLLTPTGVFVLQCPNGTSKEGVLFPGYWKKFLKNVRRSNQWGRLQAYRYSLTQNYGWGIEPIRHLWAVSGAGIEACLREDKRFVAQIKSASLTDPVFSPYWQSTKPIANVAWKMARPLVGRVIDGMHLVAEIRRNDIAA